MPGVGGVGGGSSPHARGLLLSPTCMTRTGRIIPARAGFTELIVVMHRWGKDHPRTRGVYNAVRMSPMILSGSSPHARGLPRSTLG